MYYSCSIIELLKCEFMPFSIFIYSIINSHCVILSYKNTAPGQQQRAEGVDKTAFFQYGAITVSQVPQGIARQFHMLLLHFAARPDIPRWRWQ